MIERYGKSIDLKAQRTNFDRAAVLEQLISVGEEYNSIHMNIVCPLCVSNITVPFVIIRGYLWRTCRACGVCYVSNIRNTKCLYKLYEGTDESTKIINKHVTEDLKARARDLFLPKIEFVEECIDHYMPDGTWLDIGSGVGEVSYTARILGWKVTSIDPNKYVRDAGKRVFNVDMVDGKLDDDLLDTLKDTYDIVSLFNILEHVISPRDGIRIASKLNNENGYLVIEVPHFPNLTALMATKFPDLAARIITAPYHLYMFSLLSLKMMLKDYGYKIVGVWYFGMDFIEMVDIIDELGSQMYSIYPQLSKMAIDVQKVMDEHKLSEYILIVARRINEL